MDLTATRANLYRVLKDIRISLLLKKFIRNVILLIAINSSLKNVSLSPLLVLTIILVIPGLK